MTLKAKPTTGLARWWRHLLHDDAALARHLPDAALAAIEAAVAEGERTHGGELRFVVESNLTWAQLAAGTTARDRAHTLFSSMGVWDTEDNCGVLIYVLWADHRVEIVADRGICARVPQAQWDGIVDALAATFAQGQGAAGAVAAVQAVSALLATHFPRRQDDRNELPDAPVLI